MRNERPTDGTRLAGTPASLRAPLGAGLIRADRVCGVRHAPDSVPHVPPASHTPAPLLMGRPERLAARGESVLLRYYAVEERATGGLLCTPSQGCGAAVVALYGSVTDASMARRDWFRHAFSEILCVPGIVSDVARVRVLTRAEAYEIRRSEALARGEEWHPDAFRLPAVAPPVGPVPSVRPWLRGYWPALVVAAAVVLAVWVTWYVCSLPPLPAPLPNLPAPMPTP
jgi:hypothetical protein